MHEKSTVIADSPTRRSVIVVGGNRIDLVGVVAALQLDSRIRVTVQFEVDFPTWIKHAHANPGPDKRLIDGRHESLAVFAGWGPEAAAGTLVLTNGDPTGKLSPQLHQQSIPVASDTTPSLLYQQLRGPLGLREIRRPFGSLHELPVALSPREQEVWQLTAHGRTVTEIATILGVSESTIDGHKTRLMRKLGVRKSVGLVRMAFEQGIVA